MVGTSFGRWVTSYRDEKFLVMTLYKRRSVFQTLRATEYGLLLNDLGNGRPARNKSCDTRVPVYCLFTILQYRAPSRGLGSMVEVHAQLPRAE